MHIVLLESNHTRYHFIYIYIFAHVGDELVGYGCVGDDNFTSIASIIVAIGCFGY